jgi:hypothetical protein
MKLFEEFMQADYEMDRIIKQLIERINYWFKDGSFSLSSAPIDITKSTTPNASKRAIITNFADAEFYYQLIIKIYIEDLENCDIILKKYDPNKIDEPNGGQPISQIDLTNDKQVKINDIKEDFIIKKISELDDKKENPDENKIETPKEKEEKPTQGQQQIGVPPGSMPPPGAQMSGMPPVQGISPQMGGTPMQTQM